MKSKILSIFFVAACILTFTTSASAEFAVDWGNSNDNGNVGSFDLQTWFNDNGFASINAETDYIGYDVLDADPFSFVSTAGVDSTFAVVQRLAGNAAFTSFGYYTGSGAGKTLTEVLAPGVNTPTTVEIGDNSFGLYMKAPKWWHANQYFNWYTDRAENDANQTGPNATNAGGDPQALIYQLGQNDYLVAWEDLDYSKFGTGGSDHDFNDAYVRLTVTPEPASMALFGLGAGALGLARRRRKTKTS